MCLENFLRKILRLKKNWDSNVLDYSIHVFHSRALSDEKKNQLESLGCEVIHDPYEFIPYMCRESVFKYEMDGEYTLLLDTDMVVLKTPVFEYEKDVYARKAGSQSVTNITESDILSLEVTMGSPSNKYIHFNGGCVLIRNSIKNEFHKRHVSNSDSLVSLLKKNKHLGMQVYISLLIQGFSWDYLDKGVNVFTQEIKSKGLDEISILHYLGEAGFTADVSKILKSI